MTRRGGGGATSSPLGHSNTLGRGARGLWPRKTTTTWLPLVVRAWRAPRFKNGEKGPLIGWTSGECFTIIVKRKRASFAGAAAAGRAVGRGGSGAKSRNAAIEAGRRPPAAGLIEDRDWLL